MVQIPTAQVVNTPLWLWQWFDFITAYLLILLLVYSHGKASDLTPHVGSNPATPVKFIEIGRHPKSSVRATRRFDPGRR